MNSVFVREALGDFSALALKALEESDFEKDEHENMESRPFPGWIDPEVAQAWDRERATEAAAIGLGKTEASTGALHCFTPLISCPSATSPVAAPC